MAVVEDSLLIHAAPGALFDLAQDYQLRLEWDPFLRALRFLDGAREARVGTRVWVRAHNGLTMEVEYTALDRPRVVAMRMTRGPWMFSRFAGSWRFEANGESGATRVVFRYGYALRGGRLGAMVEPIVRRVFGRDIAARLRGLKRAAETTDILTRLPVAAA